MDERGKIEFIERAIVAWNKGDFSELTAELSDDFVWDMTRSDVPGESKEHRGPDAYVSFAHRWREALGPTQVELEEVKHLHDGRMFVLIRTWGTGARSGADVDLHYATIYSFEGGKATRAEVFADQRKGRAAAGLDS